MTAELQQFLHGARATVPLVIGSIPFGIIFGTIATVHGLSWQATAAMSVFVFAGSSQFIALGLLGSGALRPIVVLTTFIVNFRHLLYAATMVPHIRHISQPLRIPMAFLLTDESFAVGIKKFSDEPSSPQNHCYYFGSALAMFINWQICTAIGLTAGRAFPGIASWGLDFAMPVTFIGMLVPYLINRPMVVAVAVAGLVALLGHGLPHKLGLMLGAGAGIASGLMMEYLIQRTKR